MYHNSCMVSYLRSSTDKVCETDVDTDHSQAFQNLISEIEDNLKVHKKAFFVSDLRDRYQRYLPESSPIFKDCKLQQKLQTYYSDKIIVQQQQGQGMSNIIMSSFITLYDAVKAAADLKVEFKAVQSEILCTAAAILRQEINSIPSFTDYPSPSNVTQKASEEYIHESLIQFIEWLIDDSAFSLNKQEYISSDNIKKTAISLAECIIFNITKTFTHLHLGLGMEWHHNYGSKQLIETLNSYGFCISYELRRFITGAAMQEVAKLENHKYIPTSIIPIKDGGGLIQEGDDNIDINCETIDGKNTFHSMARVVFQKQSPKSKSKV